MSLVRDELEVANGREGACNAGLAFPTAVGAFNESGGGAPRPRLAIVPPLRRNCALTPDSVADEVPALTAGSFSAESVEVNPILELGRDGGGKFNFSNAVDRVLSDDPALIEVSEVAEGGGATFR